MLIPAPGGQEKHAHENEAICAIWPVQDGVQTYKSPRIAESRGTQTQRK